MGLLKGNRAEEIIRTLAKNKCFSHTDIPLVVTATDIVTGKHIILKEGNISRAVRASISIPGVFEPVEMGDMVLVDGAVTERVPVHAIRELEPDIVIAVDVGYRGISRQKPANIFEALLLSFEVMEWGLVHEHLVHADVLVTPDVYQINPASLKETEKCIQLGREGAKEAIGRIRETIEKWQDHRITSGCV
jgi:NTE family protein